MIEFIKHLFGFCGEPHPSLLTGFLVLLPGITYIKYKFNSIKNKFK